MPIMHPTANDPKKMSLVSKLKEKFKKKKLIQKGEREMSGSFRIIMIIKAYKKDKYGVQARRKVEFVPSAGLKLHYRAVQIVRTEFLHIYNTF